MAIEDEMATILRGFEEIWNKGNVSMMDETWAADAILHVPIQTEPLRGRETAKALVKQLRAAFPDFHVTPEDSFAEGNLVIVRYTMRGTHLGDYFVVPATHRTVVSPEIEIFRVEDGLIQEMFLEFDVMNVLSQLGVMPGLDTMPAPLVRLLAWRQRRRTARAAAGGVPAQGGRGV